MYDSTYFKDEFNNINYQNDNVSLLINRTFRKNPGIYRGIDDPKLIIQTFSRNLSDDILDPENENMFVEEEQNANIFKEIKETQQIKVNEKLKKECIPIEPKIIQSVKEENIQPIFHLFTKKSDDQIDYIKEYFENPFFKDFNLINDDEERKDNKRKFNMDNMSKKVRQKISSKLVEIFGDELKKLSFKKFNQDGNSIKNKNYLNMSVKELLINILLENINKNTTINNDYFLTKEDEKFIESLANNDERLKFILNMKMEDIYNEFFDSKEYPDLIKELIEQKNDYYYIHHFIKKNKNFVEYYKNAKEPTNKNN